MKSQCTNTIMAKTPILILTLVVLLALTSCITGTGTTHDPNTNNTPDSKTIREKSLKENLKMLARDAITLTIAEAREIKKFIDRVPQLKSLEATMYTTPEGILNCREGLIENISQVRTIINRLRHMKKNSSPTLASEANSLKQMVDPIISSGNRCYLALRDVDEINVTRMLLQKLNDMSVLIDDVVDRVTQFEQQG